MVIYVRPGIPAYCMHNSFVIAHTSIVPLLYVCLYFLLMTLVISFNVVLRLMALRNLFYIVSTMALRIMLN